MAERQRAQPALPRVDPERNGRAKRTPDEVAERERDLARGAGAARRSDHRRHIVQIERDRTNLGSGLCERSVDRNGGCRPALPRLAQIDRDGDGSRDEACV